MILIVGVTACVLSAADVTSILKPPASAKTEVDMLSSNVAPAGENPLNSKVQEIKPVIAGFEVYGSSRVNATLIKQSFGTELEQWFRLGLAADPSVTALEKKLSEAIRQKFDLAYAEWSIVEHLEPSQIGIYITLDVVEKKDVPRRMNFKQLDSPAELPDPGGLIALWDEYQKTGLNLVEIGELQLDAVDCEAFHCPFGHKHPRLQKYEKLFTEGVKKHADKLAEVLAKHTIPEHRAAAAFLLAYSKDGKSIVERLVPSVRDTSDLVRNNALRVLGDIAEFHPEIIIPTKSVAAALEYPRVTDRSKAINVVYFLAMSSPQTRQYLIENSLGTLLAMLACEQPDHRLAAHAILRKVSGKNHTAADFIAWSNWVKRTGSSRSVSKER